MAAVKLTDRQISDGFFGAINVPEGIYQCNICSKSFRKGGSSYSNLASHVKQQHKSDLETFVADKQAASGRLDFDLFSAKTKEMFGWIEYVVMENLPYAFVESPLARKYTNLPHISRHRIANVVHALYTVVFDKVVEQLPQKFGLMFDGWSERGFHYIACFAVYGEAGCRREILLHFGQFLSEGTFTAADHILFFEDVLEKCKRDKNDVLFLVSDNCSVVTKTAKDMNIPLVGCACNRLNLEVVRIYNDMDNRDTISAVYELMKRLQTLKGRAKLLATGCKLAPIGRDNNTRWGNVQMMLKRYTEILPYLRDEDDFWGAYLLSPRQNGAVKALLAELTDFEKVNKYLQSDSAEMNLLVARNMFDKLMADHPSCGNYISPHAPIVHSPNFEAAVAAVIEGREEYVAATEDLAPWVAPFLLSSEDEAATESSRAQTFEDIIQVAKRPRRAAKYSDLRYIPPTSTTVERFFSTASRTLGAMRHRLSDESLCAVLFLQTNRRFWDIADVSLAVPSCSEFVNTSP